MCLQSKQRNWQDIVFLPFCGRSNIPQVARAAPKCTKIKIGNVHTFSLRSRSCMAKAHRDKRKFFWKSLAMIGGCVMRYCNAMYILSLSDWDLVWQRPLLSDIRSFRSSCPGSVVFTAQSHPPPQLTHTRCRHYANSPTSLIFMEGFLWRHYDKVIFVHQSFYTCSGKDSLSCPIALSLVPFKNAPSSIWYQSINVYIDLPIITPYHLFIGRG